MLGAGRGRQKIRAPKRGANGEDVDFEGTWRDLASAFREIHTKNASKLSYEQLYRHAYRIVLKKKGDVLYTRVREFEEKWLTEDVKARLLGQLSGHLQPNAGTTMSGPTMGEKRVFGEKFMRGIRDSWYDYQTCMNMLADVLMYMDRVYCQDQRRPSIFVTAMGLFKDYILFAKSSDQQDSPTLLDVLTSIILEQVAMDRAGDEIDKHLIKSCVYMLEGLYNDPDMETDEHKLYNAAFEETFLRASREFYRAEGINAIQVSDAGSYAAHTMRRINEEMDRCRSTLAESTSSKIVKVVEDELISDRMKDLIESETGVRSMVDNDRLDDLGRIFDLNRRVDAQKTELRKAIQGIISDMGNEVNKAASLTSMAPPAPVDQGEKEKGPTINQQTVAAIKWVEDVLHLKDKFDKIWRVSFQSDQTLQTAQTQSFASFINSTTFTRSSEYISLFIDDNMKRGIKGKTESETDAVLDKAITLLRYVQDKDLFERYYKKHLCKRLLMNKSLSNDVEKQMISRMKIELGNNFTVKLEGMFKDMAISEELTSGYKEHIAKLGDPDPKRIDLAINVLTSMTWPLEIMAGSQEGEGNEAKKQCIYPAEVDRIKMGFEKYYSEKHSGRKLSWQPNMGTADVRATFPKVPSKDGHKERKHELNVSTYAMIILLLFNGLPQGAHLTFEDIQAATNIPTNELVRNLQSLAIAPKTRILLKEPMSKDVKPHDKFFFNEGFQGKFVKIKVGVVSSGNKVEAEGERQETERKNNDSRGYVIEAAVVRIMKQRKDLAHAQLITETLQLLAQQFKPDVNMIKKKIESLIEREYLERIDDAPVPSYRYLA